MDERVEKQDTRKLGNGIWQRDDFRKFAMESLDNFNKKATGQVHRDKSMGNKKFIISNNAKTKKK